MSSALASTDDEITSYIYRYGGNCRDCADYDGVCPSKGIPCNPDEAKAIFARAVRAIRYGVEHGFVSIAVAPQPPAQEVCRYCGNTGYFYSDPELGPCGCGIEPPPTYEDGRRAGLREASDIATRVAGNALKTYGVAEKAGADMAAFAIRLSAEKAKP